MSDMRPFFLCGIEQRLKLVSPDKFENMAPDTEVVFGTVRRSHVQLSYFAKAFPNGTFNVDFICFQEKI